ncbi:MAG: hypothetical protein WCO35_01155 [Candidatus Nomurabacteria bacterium]
MRQYKEKFLWRNIFYSNFTIVVISILLFFVISGLYKLYVKYEITQADLVSVNKDKLDEQQKLAATQNKLDAINTEPGQEKYIRETYSLKKQGEGVIIIYDTPSSTYVIPKSSTFWDSVKSFFQNLW